MTREEAIKELKEFKNKSWDGMSEEVIDIAISALEQEQDMTIAYLMGKYEDKEPCEEFINVPRKALKFRTTNFVGYNVEWLKKHWQMEMDIVCGVKPCEDAISREAGLNTINAMRVACDTNDIADYYILLLEAFKQLPPVTPKPTECKDCVSREAVIDILQYAWESRMYIPECIREVKDLPSVTPSRHNGHWIGERDDYGEIQGWHCDKCYEDSGFTTDCKWDYCPNCGAEMESEE